MSKETPNNNNRRQHSAYDQAAHSQGQSGRTSGSGSGQVYRTSSSGSGQTRRQGGQNAHSPAKNSQRTAGKGQSTKQQQAASGGVHRSAKSKARLRRKRNRRIAIVTIVLVIILALALGVYLLYRTVAKELRGEATVDGSIPEAVKTVNVPEYDGKKLVCGVVCGIDYDLDESGNQTKDQIGRTDMILYVMFDTETGKANILQIPRDVYVGDTLNTGGTYKINGLYYSADDPNNRMAPLLSMLNDQLGLPTDFYVTIDMDALKEIVAIKGSIDVYVPQDVVDGKNPNNVIKEGWRGIGADEVEFLLRNRNYPNADLTRLQVQQNFYSALFREFSTLAPKDLVMWMEVLLWRVNVGGMSPLQIGGLAQKVLGVKGENITFVRPPVVGVRYKGYDMVSLVADETADLLNEYFRPEGSVKTVKELNIYELNEYDIYGKVEASVRTMSDIQETEPEKLD